MSLGIYEIDGFVIAEWDEANNQWQSPVRYLSREQKIYLRRTQTNCVKMYAATLEILSKDLQKYKSIKTARAAIAKAQG